MNEMHSKGVIKNVRRPSDECSQDKNAERKRQRGDQRQSQSQQPASAEKNGS